VLRLPVAGRALHLLYRMRTGLPQAAQPMRHFLAWLVQSNEHTNYTYDLDPINQRHLAAFVAEVASTSFEGAENHIAELRQNQPLREHIRAGVRNAADGRFADAEVRFGRRLGWYALIRALKPRVVVETGVDKGLGACVITAALIRNADDGSPGEYYGTDIDPRKGYLLSGEYARYGKILYGDSIASLDALDRQIDLFINDSDHSSAYEKREYEVIEPKLSPGAIVLSDNANVTDELLHFALRTKRRFLYFQERPTRHWYPGDGIGAAFGRVQA
jgi:hypothetical protein